MNTETETPGTHDDIYHTLYDNGVADRGYFDMSCTLCAGPGDYSVWTKRLESQDEPEEHLAGYEVSQNASKGAKSQHTTDPDELCPVCYHHHEVGTDHLDVHLD